LRYVLLDRITVLEPPELARGVKCVSLSDDCFADHFPGHPVMPGALILESLAQLGGVLLEQTHAQRDVHALLTIVERCKFRRLVRPGDKLDLEARVLVARDEGGQIRGTARVENDVAAEMELAFVFVKVTNPVVLAKRREVLNIWLRGSSEDV
jgi:3-hydroxymyristoyl/3-hydroxydecanoyl-(acyl carrier protein) dehydratase